jgi:tape measure domain-containing protein|nr:MAG TPA: Tail tape measure [Caudoviricetes sp.]
MATIKSSIVVQDMASSVFAKIHSNVSKTTAGFKNLNSEMSNAPTKAINNAERLNASAVKTELAYQAELQVLRQVESEAKKIIAAEGTQSAKAQDLISSVVEQRRLVEGLKKDYDNVSSSIKNSQNSQESFNNSVKKTQVNQERLNNSIKNSQENQDKFSNSINTSYSNGNKLLSTIKKVALAVGGISAIKGLLNLSDEMTNNKARLNLIVDDGGSVEALQNKIFVSAMNARASYQTTTDIITKLGLQAGKAFKGNDELIAFAEQLNKTFAISGTEATGIESTMYNLTQALSTGVLRGQDLNAVFSNAPQIVQNIADYLNVPIGKIRDMAADGKISAQIVKNAMLKAADETNAKFNKMPMTWNQVFTKMKNIAIKALDPVLNKINALANNQQVQEMFNMFINGASLAAQAILSLIEGISWLLSVLEPVAPVILGLVGAYVGFNIVSMIASGLLGMLSIAHGIAGAAEMLHSGQTMAATAAQWGLNSALLACPITWIVILIMALIVALTYLWFTNDKVAYGILYVWDALKLGIMVAGLGIQGVFYAIVLGAMALWLGIQTCVLGAMGAWYAFQTGVEAVCLGVLSIFQGLYNGVVWLVNRNNSSVEQNTRSANRYR